MTAVLNHNLFLVKEHVGMFKAASNYDVLDPETGEILMECREENLGFFTKMLRFTDYKRMTPFNLVIRDRQGQQLLRVRRGVSIWLSVVEVFDEADRLIGKFRQKFFTIGGAFTVLDQHDHPVCELKGKWTSWEFSFRAGDEEYAQVSKKWSGIGKELFTSADNYVLRIDEDVPPDNAVRQLILAAVMCIDLVLKE